MKKTALILSGLLLSASALADDGSADAVNGKRLFEENPNKCLRCHTEGAGLSTAADVAMLEAKVRNCDVSHQTNWYDDEILDVVAYLDQEYYHFSPATPEAAPAAPVDTSALENDETEKTAVADAEVAAQ